jgi:hypothetical protein
LTQKIDSVTLDNKKRKNNSKNKYFIRYKGDFVCANTPVQPQKMTRVIFFIKNVKSKNKSKLPKGVCTKRKKHISMFFSNEVYNFKEIVSTQF